MSAALYRVREQPLLRAPYTLGKLSLPPVESLLRPWTAFSLLMFSGLSVYVVAYEKTAWKKVMLLTIAMTILPFVSFDYKLTQFFIPLFLFFDDDRPANMPRPISSWWAFCSFPNSIWAYGCLPLCDPFIMIFIGALVVVSHGRLSLGPLKAFRFRARSQEAVRGESMAESVGGSR